VTALLAMIGFLAFVATALGAGLVHAHVTTGERIAYLHERVGTVEGIQAEDHDRLARIEAQLEYVAKLSLLQINEERAEKGKPLVPDEFPRGVGGR
jgi:hypothetical protein